MATLPLPDGSAVRVRDGETSMEAWNRAMHMYPEAFNIEQKHGFFEAAKEGVRRGVGMGIKGIGVETDSPSLQAYGEKLAAPSQEPGAYHPYTKEEKQQAWDKGLMSGLGAEYSANVGENLGNMAGSFAIPTAAGMVGTALGGPVAGGAAFTAAYTPTAIGENEEYNNQLRAQGTAVPEQGKAEKLAWGLAQSAIVPLTGAVGSKLVAPFMKVMGAPLAETATKVANGQMTYEAAVKELNSLGRNVLTRTVEGGGVGATMMTGTTAMQRAQAGQEMTSPEAMGQYGQSALMGIALAPLGGVAGAFDRMGQMKAVKAADTTNTAMMADANARNKQVNSELAARDEADRKEQAWQQNQGEQQGLPLEEPKQPKAPAFTGGGFDPKDQLQLQLQQAQAQGAAPEQIRSLQAQIDSYKAPATNAVIDDAWFDAHGIPAKGKGLELRNQFNGIPVDDTVKLQELLKKLEPLANATSTKIPVAAYARAANDLTNRLDTAARAEQAPDAQQGDMLYQQQAKDSFARMQQKASQARIDKNTQKALTANAESKQAAIKDAASQNAAINARNESHTTDMFSGERVPVDTSKPEAPYEQAMQPSPGMPITKFDIAQANKEMAQRKAELYVQFERMNDHWQKTGDREGLDAVLARAKQLEAEDASLNQMSTKGLFDAKGRPTKTAMRGVPDERTTGVPEGNDRTGNGPDVPTGPAGGAGGVEPIDAGAGPSVRPAAPVVAPEERVHPAVKTTTPAQAAREWARSGAAQEYEQTYKELHPQAQELFRNTLEANKVAGKELTGHQIKETFAEHMRANEHKVEPDDIAARATGKKNQTVHTKEEATLMVKNITDKWTNAPEVEVKDFLELSPERQAWVNENKAAGFIEKGKITIVSDRNTDLPDVKATLFHEALGHYGLRTEFGKELKKMMQDMYDTHPGMRAAADAQRKHNRGLTDAQAVEEVLAERQVGDPLVQNLVQKATALLRSYLRKLGLDIKYSKNDVVAVLRRARAAVETGEKKAAPVGEIAARSKAAKEEKFSDSIPNKLRVTIEHEGPDGEPVMADIHAKTEMRLAERRLTVMQKLLECLA